MSITPDAQLERGFGGLYTNNKSLKFQTTVQAQRTRQGQTSTIKGNPAALLSGILQPLSHITKDSMVYKIFAHSAGRAIQPGGKGRICVSTGLDALAYESVRDDAAGTPPGVGIDTFDPTHFETEFTEAHERIYALHKPLPVTPRSSEIADVDAASVAHNKAVSKYNDLVIPRGQFPTDTGDLTKGQYKIAPQTVDQADNDARDFF